MLFRAPSIGAATRPAPGLVRSDRDEHAAGTPAGVRRIGERDVSEGVEVWIIYESNVAARQLLKASIVYLPLAFVLMIGTHR